MRAETKSVRFIIITPASKTALPDGRHSRKFCLSGKRIGEWVAIFYILFLQRIGWWGQEREGSGGGPSIVPRQIPVPSSFTSCTLFCPLSGIQPDSQQECRRVKSRFGYLWLNHPAIHLGSWCILLAWQWIHLFIFCLRIFFIGYITHLIP